MNNMKHEKGYVLVTSLVMLGLLTMFSVAMYFVGRSATQTSDSAQRSTEAYYYAETAIHYITWALRNDAEIDSFQYSGSALFGEPPTPATMATVGDYTELASYMWNPGPTAISDATDAGTNGQVMYFDNSPMGNRYICMQDAATYSNCIDVTLAPANRVQPVMYNISVNLPRYIKLEISSSGVITPSIPSLPHQNPPVVGTDIPNNGAVVWITAGDTTNANRDIEIYPLDPSSVYAGVSSPSVCGDKSSSCPCDASDAGYSTAQSCDANTGAWIGSYSIVAYAIGYVDGRPTHMIRAVIM